MTVPRFPRPCPIPGHPQDDEPAPLAPESAWSRLRAWHLHAPAERLPLPLALTAWPATWVLHVFRVPGHVVAYTAIGAVLAAWLTWRQHEKRVAKATAEDGQPPHPRLAAAEAATVAAAAGGWVAAAVTYGPLGWPAHLLSWIYLTGAIGGYIWLRKQEAVRAARKRRDEAAAWTARKAEWHRIAHLIGLGDFHLQSVTKTHLGEELLLTSAPGSELASSIAASNRPYAEKYAHLRGLPYGRIGIRKTEYPGQLVIEVREQDPSVNGPVIHPALDPPSPYKAWFPERRSIRQPIPIGVIPETGEPMELVLFDDEGGKAVGVYSMTGGGKTNTLDDIREWITACDDAVLYQFNAAGSGDERAWQPLAALTAAGLAEENPQVKQGILVGLGHVRHLIGDRSETAADTGESVFQPTRADPAVVVIIDEIDETGKIEGASKLLEFLASKQRKAAVCLILAGQRATAIWTGGAGVRINLSTLVIGVLARDSETRHAVGAENEIPDISEYSGGQAGYFGTWSVRQKRYTQRGRAFFIGKIGVQKEKIIAKRDPAARPVLAGAGEVAAPVPVASEDQGGSVLRERLARVQALNEGRQFPVEAPLGGTLPVVPGVPMEDMPVLLRLLASPEGTTAALAGLALGKSKSLAHQYLTALRDHNIAKLTGSGRGSRFRRCWPEPAPEPQRYTTIEALAQLVHEGVIEVEPDQREILEQAWQIAHRAHLTLVPPLQQSEDDAS